MSMGTAPRWSISCPTSTSRSTSRMSASSTRTSTGATHEDVEVVTIHYRGAHGAAAARSGFACYGGSSARITGGGGGGGRGGDHAGGLAEELWK
jgi:hypothetical protein